MKRGAFLVGLFILLSPNVFAINYWPELTLRWKWEANNPPGLIVRYMIEKEGIGFDGSGGDGGTVIEENADATVDTDGYVYWSYTSPVIEIYRIRVQGVTADGRTTPWSDWADGVLVGPLSAPGQPAPASTLTIESTGQTTISVSPAPVRISSPEPLPGAETPEGNDP